MSNVNEIGPEKKGAFHAKHDILPFFKPRPQRAPRLPHAVYVFYFTVPTLK